jgi:magnesium transporter
MDADPEQLRLGPYAVMHAIADHVVDSYFRPLGDHDGHA